MAVAPAGKRPKASLVKQASIDHTSAFLQALPDKPKEDMSLREAIDQMRDSLKAALSKGYTYQELAAMLTDQGIKISAFTLKNYVPSGRRRSKEQPPAPTTVRKSRKSKAEQVEAIVAKLAQDPAPAAQEVLAEASPAETPVTPISKSRRKSTTAAKAKTDDEATVKQSITKRPAARKPVAKTASTAGKSSSAKKPSSRPSAKSRSKKAES